MSKLPSQAERHKAKRGVRRDTGAKIDRSIATVKSGEHQLRALYAKMVKARREKSLSYAGLIFTPYEPSQHKILDKFDAEGELISDGLTIAKLPYEVIFYNEAESLSPDIFNEQTRITLLDAATNGIPAVSDPFQTLEDTTRAETVAVLGGEPVLGRAITNDQELLDALIQGFSADVLNTLREAGLPHSVFEQVVAPRRTLMRRKAEGQRLTRAESDAVWRLANVFALATRVLNGRKAAIDWLTRAKPTFANRTPIDLLETSVGAAHVNRMLQRLEWGDVA